MSGGGGHTKDVMRFRVNSVTQYTFVVAIKTAFRSGKQCLVDTLNPNDCRSYLAHRNIYYHGTVPLSGLKVRDGLVTIGNSYFKFIFSYKDGLANGPYWYYGQWFNHYGQCVNGRKSGKEYHYRSPDHYLHGIIDYDNDYRVMELNNSTINIDLTAVGSSARGHYQFYKGRENEFERYEPPNSSGSVEYHRNGDITHVRLLVTDNVSASCRKSNGLLGEFSFNHQNYRMIGTAEPLTIWDRLYYFVKWLCPRFIPYYY